MNAGLSTLSDQLARLHLHAAAQIIDQRLQQATTGNWPASQLLAQVLDDELAGRSNRSLARRIVCSRIDPAKSLETFDFRAANGLGADLNEPTIREFATGTFIDRAEVLLVLGPSGVGKSHLVQALGIEACRRGHSALFGRTDQILTELRAGHADRTHARRLKHLIGLDLLILDDFGLIPLDATRQTDLYEIICGRYERRATIITSNRDFGEWMSIFDNQLIASAALDRLVHRALRLTITGKSHRAEAFAARHRALPSTARRQTS
jgi:DNA replication protein DnaC